MAQRYSIQGALANLGHVISDQTVGNILKAHGIEPADRRKHNVDWATFLKAHWDVLAAVDFTTIEVWTRGGLVTFYLLFVISAQVGQACGTIECHQRLGGLLRNYERAAA